MGLGLAVCGAGARQWYPLGVALVGEKKEYLLGVSPDKAIISSTIAPVCTYSNMANSVTHTLQSDKGVVGARGAYVAGAPKPACRQLPRQHLHQGHWLAPTTWTVRGWPPRRCPSSERAGRS